jgi:LPXTG-motif cell wall-anchored protein
MLRLGLATSLLSVTLVTTSGLIAGPTTLAAGTPVTEDFSSGYNGGTAWNDDWDESGDDNSSGSGTIEINSGNLRFEDLDDDSISRTLDLSAFTQGAVFSYTLASESGDEQLRFEFRTGEGGTFTEIARSAANAPDGTRYSFVLTSAMIRTNAELRIRSGSDNWSSSESIEIDDLGIDNPVPNPDFAAACGTDVILILDESGSIDNDGEDPSFITSVESAVTAFVDSLEGTGSKMRITEFSNNGRDALIGGTTAFQPVDAGFNTAVQTYLTTPNQNAQEPTSYNPGKGQNNTNWQAGIEAATTPGSTATGGIGAPLVVFFTDGKPNTIGLTGNSSNNNGGGDNNAAAAAYAQMEALRSAGSHVLSVAVGNAFTDPAAFTRLTEITEAIPPVQIWDNPADPLDIRTTDVLGVEDFSALPNALREVVFALCAPSVALNKFNQNGEAVPNWAFDLTVESLTGPATNNPIVWVSPSHGAATAPSTKTQNTDSAGIALFQWTPGSLATPQPWDSTISFSEDLLDNWQIDPATYAPGNNNCTVKRLSEDDFTVNIVKTSPSDPLPGSVVTFKLQEGDVQNGFTDFIVGQADIVSCTVTNIEPIAIRVVKDLVPAADSGRFDLLINATVQAEDVGDSGGGATTNTEVPAGSTVTVSEIANNTTNPTDLDDYQSALSCPDATLDINTGTNGTFTAPPSAAGDSVACTFTNIRKTSPLTVDKTWDNAGLGDTVSISIDATNDASGSSTAQTANETDSDVTGTTVFSGETVGLAESFTTGSAANYNSSLACAYGASNTQIAVINSSIVIPPAAADSTIRCTFTNDAKPASITIIKDVTNTSNGFNTNVFDFAGDLGAFTLVDDGVGTADNSITFDNLVAGQYTVTETDANANGFGLEAINCGDATTTPSGTDGVTITLDQAASVTCTFVNQAEASLTITKTAAAIQPVAADSDTFTIAYDVVVTNTGPGTTTYDLSDRANFGSGATITNVEVNSTRLVAPLNNPTNPIVTNQSIVGGGTSHTYTIDITFDVAPNMVPSERNCVTNTAGQGTYNSATITFSDSTASDNDCVSLPDPTPTITKTIGDDQPAAVDDDTSTVEYAIVVANPGPGQAIYTLTDTPDFGTGATITRIEVELPGGAALIPDLPIVGGTIVSDEPIDAGSSETYIITVTFGVDASTTAANRRCVTNTPHRGAFNTATITFPGGSSSANDCGSIPEPNITTTKTIVGAPSQPVQVGTGFQYTVDYTVDVRNTGTGIGSYTLIDDPNFGGGVTIDSMVLVAPLPASANAAFGLGDLAIVSNQTALAPNTSETFTVRATFTVAAGTTVTQRDCTIGTDPGTGTFNTVTVTPNIGAPTSDDACVPIPDPNVTVTKNVTSGPTYNSTNDNYTISYDITATNNGNGPGTYDLADTPTFANGTTITNVTVDSTQIPTGTVDNPTNPIVNDEPIAAGNTHNYTATITFTVDPGTTTEQRDCTIGTDPGTGTLNTVTVTPNIGDPDSGSDCSPVPTPQIKIIKTLIDGPTATAPGSSIWTATYELQIDNVGDGPGTYDLADRPGFATGLTISDHHSTSTDVPMNGDFNTALGNTSIATGIAIGPDGRHLVEVVVTFAATNSVDPADRVCGQDPGPGDATFNATTVTPNIGPPSSDHACGPLPDPEVTVIKTIRSAPIDNGDNTFTIVYAIDVTNAANAGPAAYDLADQASFSRGVTIKSQSVANMTPGSITVDPSFPTSGTIVIAEPIAASSTHSYEVTVVAKLAVDTGTTYQACSSTTGNAGEGLFNRALLTVDGTTTTDHACADIEGDLTIEKTDGGIELQGGDGPFGYTLTVINVGGASTGDRVTVTDQLPDQFAWVSFPSASGSFPFCTQAGQVLTCQLDASLVDAGGESTSFVVTARAREGIAANEVGYRNMSFVDSPGDPAPTSPSCSDIGTAVSFSAFTNPDNNVACDETPMRPGAVLAAGAIPTLPPTTTTQPPPLAPPIVPPQGLPATGSSDSSNALGLAALLLVLGSSLTFIVRRRQNVAQIAGR